jgi:hypothetical protein
MHLMCLIGKHDWTFGYNKGIPLGTTKSIGEVLDDLHTGKAQEILVCRRHGCPAQSMIVDDKRVMLKPHERERP